MHRRKRSRASWECGMMPVAPLSTSASLWSEERESTCDYIHKAGWEGGRSEDAGGGVAHFPHLLDISPWANTPTPLMISMKDKHQGTRHWGLGSSWALQQGDSPPTARLAGRSHVFIKSRAFHVLWKPPDEWAVSSRKVNGRRRDPSGEKELRAGPCQRIGT